MQLTQAQDLVSKHRGMRVSELVQGNGNALLLGTG